MRTTSVLGTAIIAGVLLFCGAAKVEGQVSPGFPPLNQTGPPGRGNPNQNGPFGADNGSAAALEKLENERVKLREADRQKKLIEDTNKLLALANELKADMDKSGKDVLSLEVVKKAEEIERLARSVKERMRS